MHSYVLLLTTEDKGRKEVHNILGEIIMAKNNLVGTRPTVIVSLALFIFLMGAAFFLGEEEVTPPAKPVAEEVVVSEAPEVSEWKYLGMGIQGDRIFVSRDSDGCVSYATESVSGEKETFVYDCMGANESLIQKSLSFWFFENPLGIPERRAVLYCSAFFNFSTKKLMI